MFNKCMSVRLILYMFEEFADQGDMTDGLWESVCGGKGLAGWTREFGPQLGSVTSWRGSLTSDWVFHSLKTEDSVRRWSRQMVRHRSAQPTMQFLGLCRRILSQKTGNMLRRNRLKVFELFKVLEGKLLVGRALSKWPSFPSYF